MESYLDYKGNVTRTALFEDRKEKEEAASRTFLLRLAILRLDTNVIRSLQFGRAGVLAVQSREAGRNYLGALS
ncbi:unnamed protein product [Lasius platythorax]|uniref:Uncharacterized protein n=1 Tax=Lasius platythorax TaxID=488582 RepID=A0AAV2NK27_9HYME